MGKERFSNTSDYAGISESNQQMHQKKFEKTGNFLQREDEMAEFMFLGLRMTQGVSRKGISGVFRHVSIENIYGEVLEKYIRNRDCWLEESGRIFLIKRRRSCE